MSTPAAALDTGLGWAEAQFAGPRCELRDKVDRPDRMLPSGRVAGDKSLPCELPATCRLVFEHQARRGDPDDTDESLSCDYHRDEIQARLGLGGLVGPCPHCGSPIVLARVEPL